ncbi:MAG: 30S ribosomal protein S6 [Oscillospiraceae bacterium]|nr:30S ribosomal protein S6 [Oscillospiraceae bacterium]MDD7471106.1 30S ribosomal protein S6 [Oscillospiraceae bacterium]MDY2677529.1 30S ribosomal protein S6 [Oscillospiraceae bacterium]
MSFNYETVVVYSLSKGEEAAKELAEKFKAMMEAHGTVDSVDEWGKRRLAYPINDEEDGYYVLYNHQCESEFPAELDRVLRITDGVLRSLIIKK